MFSFFSSLYNIFSNFTIIDCTSPDAHLKELVLDITPKYISKGDTMNIHASGFLGKTITSGNANLEIYKNNNRLLSKNYDINDKVPCPINDGYINITFSEKIPSFILSGNYIAKLKITDQDDEEILCIEIQISF